MLIEKKYKEHTQYLEQSIKENSKRFWGYFRSKTKSKSNPAGIRYNNRIFTSATYKAEAFDQFFFSTFTREDDPNPFTPDISDTQDHAPHVAPKLILFYLFIFTHFSEQSPARLIQDEQIRSSGTGLSIGQYV